MIRTNGPAGIETATPPIVPIGREKVLTSSEALEAMREYEHYHVLTPEGVVGIVDEVIGDRDAEPVGLLVVDGWFKSRRYLIPSDDIRAIDDTARTISI